MSKSRVICFIVGVFTASGMLFSASYGPKSPNSARYIVQLRSGVNPKAVASLYSSRPGSKIRRVFTRAIHGFAGVLSAEAVAQLKRDPNVLQVVPDLPVFAIGKPNKPDKPGKGHGKPGSPSDDTIPAGVTRVGAQAAWTAGYTGDSVGVAVVDTGIDYTHPDLAPNFAGTLYDAYGVDGMDEHGHGTHVAGIIAAADNGQDVVGVAPNASLYSVRVLDASGMGYDSDVIAGIEAIMIANNEGLSPAVKVVNMSFGRDAAGAADEPLHDAVKNLVNSGVTVVVAAGNDCDAEVSDMVPAGFPEVIAVASTTAADGHAKGKKTKITILADTASYFTTDGKLDPNTGVGVTISAPGEAREDTGPALITPVGILSDQLGGGTVRMYGTSMAAPHVTGVVALLLQQAQQGDYVLTPDGVRAALMAGADRVDEAPLDSPVSCYTFDGDREGVVWAPGALGLK